MGHTAAARDRAQSAERRARPAPAAGLRGPCAHSGGSPGLGLAATRRPHRVRRSTVSTRACCAPIARVPQAPRSRPQGTALAVTHAAAVWCRSAVPVAGTLDERSPTQDGAKPSAGGGGAGWDFFAAEAVRLPRPPPSPLLPHLAVLAPPPQASGFSSLPLRHRRDGAEPEGRGLRGLRPLRPLCASADRCDPRLQLEQPQGRAGADGVLAGRKLPSLPSCASVHSCVRPVTGKGQKLHLLLLIQVFALGSKGHVTAL